jgi:predicted amidohydrolase YtcJ
MPRGAFLLFSLAAASASGADLILHGGKVVTVDSAFTVSEAVAVDKGRIVEVGRSSAILARHRGPETRMVDLEGRTALPGLTDAHVHPLGAGLSNLGDSFMVLRSHAEVQDYIREQAKKTPKGEWIMVPKTFPTRLREMRMPTREVLDAALEHPVFYDASYATGVNSAALKRSGIDRATKDPPGSRILRDKAGEPVGILTRGATSLLQGVPRERRYTQEERLNALERMLKRYMEAGLTTVGDRGVNAETYSLYRVLKDQGRLPIRVVMTARLGSRGGSPDSTTAEIQRSGWLTKQGDEWLKFGSFKVGLDGGMNAGTAYMRAPYGPFQTQLFGIDHPDNRGELFIPPNDLLTIMRAARDKGWQLSAHSQGGGAVDTLLDVYETLNKERPIAPTRSHLIHASFQSRESIARASRLGVLVDVQPDWLHFDGSALSKVVSREAMRYFIPLRSLVNAGVIFAGGSDHMVGWDKNTSVNAYNPFLGMWIAITRKTMQGEVIHPEERLTREQALKMYTIWSAYLQHSEKERGSIEPGKLADLVVIDRDYLTCPEDQIKQISPVMTIVGGQIGYSR